MEFPPADQVRSRTPPAMAGMDRRAKDLNYERRLFIEWVLGLKNGESAMCFWGSLSLGI